MGLNMSQISRKTQTLRKTRTFRNSPDTPENPDTPEQPAHKKQAQLASSGKLCFVYMRVISYFLMSFQREDLGCIGVPAFGVIGIPFGTVHGFVNCYQSLAAGHCLHRQCARDERHSDE